MIFQVAVKYRFEQYPAVGARDQREVREPSVGLKHNRRVLGPHRLAQRDVLGVVVRHVFVGDLNRSQHRIASTNRHPISGGHYSK